MIFDKDLSNPLDRGPVDHSLDDRILGAFDIHFDQGNRLVQFVDEIGQRDRLNLKGVLIADIGLVGDQRGTFEMPALFQRFFEVKLHGAGGIGHGLVDRFDIRALLRAARGSQNSVDAAQTRKPDPRNTRIPGCRCRYGPPDQTRYLFSSGFWPLCP